MKSIIFIISLIFVICSCRDDKPIEIYRMTKLNNYRNLQFYIIYNHRGKTKNELINSVIDYNRATISLDTILKYGFFRRMFFLQDKILTKDFEDGGEESIIDYSAKHFVSISWDCVSKYMCTVRYLICNKRIIPYKEYLWETPQQLDSLLNPIPHR